MITPDEKGRMSIGDAVASTSVLFSFAAGVALSAMCFRRRTVTKFSSVLTQGTSMKMSLVVRKDLKMGTGKIAAQCAHGAVAVVEEINAMRGEDSVWVSWLDAWLGSGSMKVVLSCSSEDELENLAEETQKAGIPHYVIRDAGRTQIAAGSKTVVAIGPAPASAIDKITSQLKLL